MKLDKLVYAFCGLGALLILSGICLQYFILPRLSVESAWSREDAEAHTAASMKYHNQSFDKRISQEELAATKAEYQELEDRLNAAKANRSNLPKYFQYGGYVCIGVGAASYVAQKAKSES